MYPAIAMLRVFDEAIARAFYIDYLGFTWDWESRATASDPLYAQVSRGDCVIHLTAHYGDGTPGTHLFIPVTDLDALHAEWTSRRHPHSRPGIETVPWGRVVTVIDPFDNHLNFTDWQASED